jgi:ATP-dependent 26S proteasome regulatory subunit
MPLSPAQEEAYAAVLELVANKEPLVGLAGRYGNGRSTILRNVASLLGAPLVTLSDLLRQTSGLHPLHLEEGIAQTFLEPLGLHDVVVMDDLHIIDDVCNNCFDRARPNVLPIALDAILACLIDTDKQLVVGVRHRVPAPLHQRCLYAKIPQLTPQDFHFFFRTWLGQAANDLDFERIHRFVPRLDVHQIKYASRIWPDGNALETETFLDFLEEHALVSNVDTGKVEAASLDSLHGVDEVIRSLEVDVIVPMERPDLAEQLGLEAKRGVLLYGPPGTGKTTIGRALAHRLRSKFFLIDGTVISGTQDFYRKIHRIFEGAKENAPSVLFIDDSDLLFEDSDETGLYRYLLTMLDGLESIENAQVTVILTAMNIGSLPPALIRSGRIELWLLMELPDTAARAAILQDRLQQVTPYLQITDIAPIVERTEGFTGADLRRVVTDAVNLYGYEVANQREPREPLAYFHEAIDRLAKHREQLESAPSFTGDHHGSASRRRQGYYTAMAALARVNADTD